MFSNEAGFENLQHVRSFVGQLYEFYINERNISCCWIHMDEETFVAGPLRPRNDYRYPENDVFVNK